MPQKLSNLPIGSLVKFGKHQVGSETAQPIIWLVVDKNHKGYPSNSVTLIAQKIIDIRAYDAIEAPRNDNDYTKGSVNYGESNINMWLNSSAGANAWYTAVNKYDRPPVNANIVYNTGYADRPGFLYNFTTDERTALLPTTLTVQVSQDVSTSVTSKVFLPSLWEIIGTHKYNDGSTRFGYFNTSVVTCGLTSQALTNTSSTDKPASTAVNWQYMTRSTAVDYVHCVSATGLSVGDYPGYGNKGLRPVINLSSELKMGDTTDADGCYNVFYNKVPTISGADGDLGSTSVGFDRTYTINDGDSDPVTVTEYIDNVKIRSYAATLGSTNTFSVKGNTWLKLANGNHTLKITATDGFDTTTRTYTFVKSVNTIEVQRSTPISASTKPTRLLATVVKTIPKNAIFKAYACNNGFDASPTWEEITSDVLGGHVHVFSNTVNTAGKWGVNIKVTVNRNGAEGACFISEIGGNFE